MQIRVITDMNVLKKLMDVFLRLHPFVGYSNDLELKKQIPVTTKRDLQELIDEVVQLLGLDTPMLPDDLVTVASDTNSYRLQKRILKAVSDLRIPFGVPYNTFWRQDLVPGRFIRYSLEKIDRWVGAPLDVEARFYMEWLLRFYFLLRKNGTPRKSKPQELTDHETAYLCASLTFGTVYAEYMEDFPEEMIFYWLSEVAGRLIILGGGAEQDLPYFQSPAKSVSLNAFMPDVSPRGLDGLRKKLYKSCDLQLASNLVTWQPGFWREFIETWHKKHPDATCDLINSLMVWLRMAFNALGTAPNMRKHDVTIVRMDASGTHVEEGGVSDVADYGDVPDDDVPY